MVDLERQLKEHRKSEDRRRDGDFQPSSPPGSTAAAPAREKGRDRDSWKRKQPHSEDLSLNIRSGMLRKIYSRKSSQSKRQ